SQNLVRSVSGDRGSITFGKMKSPSGSHKVDKTVIESVEENDGQRTTRCTSALVLSVNEGSGLTYGDFNRAVAQNVAKDEGTYFPALGKCTSSKVEKVEMMQGVGVVMTDTQVFASRFWETHVR